MIDVCRIVLVVLLGAPSTLAAAPSRQSAQPAPQPPAGTQPPAATPVGKQVAGTVECQAPAPPATPPTRSFNAPTGLLLIPVQSSRVADFEKFLGYVRNALAKTTDATLREQSKGMRFMKVAEAGPNGDVLFALVADPAVPCVDYGFQQILTAAFPDAKELDEVWKLYQNSVRNGGHLMNLVPVK